MIHRIRLDLALQFFSVWRAGSGEGGFATDRLVTRDSRNRPYVPASTLKGIIRQSCEKMCRTLGLGRPSDPHDANIRGNPAFAPLAETSSPVDRLFGNRFEEGGLFFRDAGVIDESAVTTCVRNRTARYRTLGTVKDQQLFSTELCAPIILRTLIDGRHKDLIAYDDENPPYDYCLLIAGILAVERIGGDKSVGAGRLASLRIADAEYNGSALNLEFALDLLELANEEYAPHGVGS